MPTDFFVRFGSMQQTGENGFWWEDFKDTLLENSRAVLITIAAIAGLAALAAITAKFLGSGLLPWVLVAGSLCAGLLHLWFLERRFADFVPVELWVYSVIIAIVLFISISIIASLFATFGWLFPVASVSAFLLPLTLDELWQRFGDLPASTPQIWYYSEDAPLQKSTTFLNSMPVRMLLHLDEQAAAERLSFQAPVRMKLGLLLFHTVQEGHAQGRIPINLTDAAEHKAGWVFYTTGLAGQRRYLDPEKGLTENRIKRNAVIHAQRQLPVASEKAKPSVIKSSPVR